MKKIILTGLFYLILVPLFAQQDAQYGQYLFNGLYINPAYAGFKEAAYMQASYRAQWTGIKGAPQSLSVSFDAPITEKNIGIGMILTQDKIGAQSAINGSANFAYRLRLNHEATHILAFGLGLGVLQTGINGNLLDPTEIGDVRIPVGFESKIVPDARAGVQYANENFFIGFAANNLFSKALANFKADATIKLNIETHFYLTAAALFPLNPDLKFKPSFLLKDDQHGPTSVDLNAFLIIKDRFWLGGIYRTSMNVFPKSNLQPNLTKRSAIGFMTDFLVQQKFRLGYSFDYSLNKLAGYEYGSHEISIGYYFTIPKNHNQILGCF